VLPACLFTLIDRKVPPPEVYLQIKSLEKATNESVTRVHNERWRQGSTLPRDRRPSKLYVRSVSLCIFFSLSSVDFLPPRGFSEVLLITNSDCASVVIQFLCAV
jgi:hypothetical protein